MSRRTGVIIGRFQTDELTDGHKKLINYVSENNDDMIIFIGSTEAVGTRRDPLDVAVRWVMVESYLYQIGRDYDDSTIMELENHISDEVWSQNLDSAIKRCNPGDTVTLYGGRDSFIPHYSGKYQTEYVPSDIFSAIGENLEVSATKRRDTVGSSYINVDASFRRGMIKAAYNNYPRVISTVDVVPCSTESNNILMGKKAGETTWRFIGGFTDPSSPSNEFDASKELFEEANLIVAPEDMLYLFSVNVDDWRYRKTPEVKVRTNVFGCKLPKNQPFKAGDDIAELGLVPLDTDLDEINPVHREIFRRLCYGK